MKGVAILNIKSNQFFEYIYTNNGEVFIYHNDSDKNKSKDFYNMLPIGTCLCSLLNEKKSFEEYIKRFSDKYKSNSKIEKSVLNNIFKDLMKISPYLEIVKLSFSDLNNDNRKTIQYKDINEIFEFIDYSINEADTYYDNIKNNIRSYGIPAVSVIEIEDKEFMNSYTITNIDELIRVCIIVLHNNKYHIKKCRLCGKYFTSLVGQTRFCDNPSTIDPSKTCKNVSKCIKDIDDGTDNISDVNWVNEFYELKYLDDILRARFRDNAKKETNQDKKQMILNNKKIYMNINSKLRKHITRISEKDKEKYIEIYKDFLNKTKNNLESDPKNFKVDTPNVKLFNDIS